MDKELSLSSVTSPYHDYYDSVSTITMPLSSVTVVGEQVNLAPTAAIGGRACLSTRFVKRELKLPWREAGPPHHHDDKVDSDQ